MTAEVLHFQPESTRAQTILSALERTAAGAGIACFRTDRYRGQSDILLLWGPGAPDRLGPMHAQTETGRRVVAMDLAYWDRDRKFRISIDAAHPQRVLMARTWSAKRFDADRVSLASLWRPEGHVLVAGIGEKAGVQYGTSLVRAWEAEMIRQITAAGRRVLYRPKKPHGAVAHHGVPLSTAGSIDQVLKGASAVITWHSNVAVDAIRLGIPAVCRDGAAAAVCGSEWRPDLQPLADATRRTFLQNLAWFQWAPTEAAGCWRFILEVLACAS